MTDRPDVPLDPVAAFSSLQVTFRQARTADAGELIQSSFTIAGQSVRIRVVGRRLAQHVVRPLAHLAMPGAAAEAPRLAIDLWDVAASEVPPPQSAPGTVGEKGAVTSSSDGRFLAHARPHSVTVLDRRDHRLVGWVASESSLPLEERARPLNLPLTVWCSDRDIHLIHAGLVAKNGQGVLLPGVHETGKSTTALACACAGFDFLADDCVALTLSARSEFQGHSLYNSVTLEAGHLARFPQLDLRAADGAGDGYEKRLIFMHRASPLRVIRAAPIRLVVMPRIVASSNSGTHPATKGEALLRLAPSSLAKRAVPAHASLSQMARLVEQVPSYWLELDDDLAEIPRRVDRLLAEAGLA